MRTSLPIAMRLVLVTGALLLSTLLFSWPAAPGPRAHADEPQPASVKWVLIKEEIDPEKLSGVVPDMWADKKIGEAKTAVTKDGYTYSFDSDKGDGSPAKHWKI